VLDTLPSARYTVSLLKNTYFVGSEGGVDGVTEVTLQNEGADQLPLPMSSTPQSARIAGKDVPLTSSKQGELQLPLAHGPNEVRVQHRGVLSTGWGFAVGALEVPGVGAEASSASLELRSGSDWLPLFQKFGKRRWVAAPSVGGLLLLVFYGVWALRVLGWVGVQRKAALGLSVLAGLLSGSDGLSHWAVLLSLSCASALWAVARVRQSDVKLVKPPRMMGFAFATLAAAVFFIASVSVFGDNIRRLFGMSADALAGDDQISSRSYDNRLTTKTMKNFGSNNSYDAPPAVSVQTYQGVGAELEVPLGTHTIELQQDMAPASAPSSASVVLVSSAFAQQLFIGLNLLALGLALSVRRQLLAGLRGRLTRVFEAPAPPAAALTHP
jgi:hypothetical protein